MSQEAAVLSRCVALAIGVALIASSPLPSVGQSTDDGVVQVVSVPESTESDYYFRFAGGFSSLQRTHNGGNLSLAFGKHAVYSTLRGEIEASFTAGGGISSCWEPDYRSCSHVHQSVNSLSLLATAYYDFRAGKAFRPFLGAGVRYEGHAADDEWGGPDSSWSSFGMGVHATAGLAYTVKPGWVVQMGWRGLFGNSSEDQLQVGLRYRR